MKAIKSYLFRPTVPVIFMRGTITQNKAQQILRQLDHKALARAKALAIVVDTKSALPAQVDIIANRLKTMTENHHLPLYGFAESHCSAQPYYLLSIADKVFCMKHSIIGLDSKAGLMGFKQLLAGFGISRRKLTSSPGMVTDIIDPLDNQPKDKVIAIRQRIKSELVEQSLANRQSKIKNNQIKPSELYVGQQAINVGLVDHIASYNSVLEREFPDCNIKPIHYSSVIESVQKKIKFVTSPAFLIVVGALMLKATIKWTLIVIIWLKAKKRKQEKKELKDKPKA